LPIGVGTIYSFMIGQQVGTETLFCHKDTKKYIKI
jgi:hypothetical protein